jgi:predicted double-glycine peptidase
MFICQLSFVIPSRIAALFLPICVKQKVDFSYCGAYCVVDGRLPMNPTINHNM